MANLDRIISRFISDKITLLSRDISAGAKSREWFLTRLQNTIQANLSSAASIPQLYSASPFVKFGSYWIQPPVSSPRIESL